MGRCRSRAAPWLMVALSAASVSDARAGAAPAPLERALALFRDGRYAEAAPALELAVAADDTDDDVALLLAIAYLRLDRASDAEPLLARAAASANDETRAAAHLYLGIVARDRGEADAARRELGIAARSSALLLAASGGQLLDRVAQHHLAFTLLVRPEIDSNVPLLPVAATSNSLPDGSRVDGDLLVLVAISLRPSRAIGLVVEETAAYRQQLTLTRYDFFADNLGVRYTHLGDLHRITVAGGGELMTLGGALFAVGAALQGSFRRALWRGIGVAVHDTFRFRSFLPDGYAAFTGPSNTGGVELSWGTPEAGVELAAGYLLVGELTADPTFTALGHGPTLRARSRVGARVDVSLSGALVMRTFSQADPTVGVRRDTQGWADVSVAVDLTRWGLGLIVGGSVLRNLSTVSDFDYVKATAHVGLAWSWAGL